MKPLAVFVRDVVAPTLRKHGFRRSHGTFRVVTDKGVAVIEVSGRGGIGRHDLDFDVGVGFTTHEDRAVFPSLAGVSAEKVRLAIGYSTWLDCVRDPGLTALDLNAKWRFNLDDAALESLFVAVLDAAATDLLHRLDCWPLVPEDSLSHPPRFAFPVELESRSRWRTGPDGQLDLHYAANSPVQRCHGSIGTESFVVDRLYDVERSGVLIAVDAQALRLLAGGASRAAWAEAIGLKPVPEGPAGAVLGVGVMPETLRLEVAGSDATLVIEVAPGRRASLALGALPASLQKMVEGHRFLHVVLVDVDREGLEALTWRSRMRLATAGKVWWAAVRVGS
ncbi:hypothetical protein [Nocardioides jejuensis]|uniref:Uncharacterized protein n=1 Tax=Nocardioides jejuensis TaxID=2502782 RepID=A0A4V2NZX6_9ACTN|nr:hypothetical protein [Nocardioides jejuensis]TCJ30752.1 hypothetical protein EPD65_01575 [Nocardioides jejuensis]